jgi:hypothetical protein
MGATGATVVNDSHSEETLEKVKRGGVPCSVDDYLRAQGRFGHLFADEAGAAIRAELQASADETARRLGLPAHGDLVRTTNGTGARDADPAAVGKG